MLRHGMKLELKTLNLANTLIQLAERRGLTADRTEINSRARSEGIRGLRAKANIMSTCRVEFAS